MATGKKIELLAPAGNMTCLHAAVRAGADAVYLGLNEFNARRGADNFNIETLKTACDYVHLRGRKIYLTFNIIIFEKEIQSALNLAIDAANAGIDAFIVQDVGFATLIKKYIKDVPLHISTQMNIHDESGLEFAKSLGAKRVTLGRELSLSDIKKLCNRGIEIECFAHGALCVCYSGQCLMSSMIGGRSANRGKCAQACRLNYEMSGAKVGPYLLSPKDLCTVDYLKDYVDMGVSSLKIEGRMKSPEYVYAVTYVYRKVLDNNFKVEEKDRKRLAQAFSRGFTDAYLKGEHGNEMMSYKRPNNRGVNIGRVKSVNKNLTIDSKVKLSCGDVLEVWTKGGRAVFTYDNLKLDYRNKDHRNIRVNDRVFRVRSAEDMFDDDDYLPKVKKDVEVTLKLNEKAKLKFGNVVVEGNVVEAARTKEINEEEVQAHINRLGGTDFEIDNIKVNLDKGLGISYSELHRLRAEAVEKSQCHFRRNINHVKLDKYIKKQSNREIEICVLATNPITARKAKKTGADKIYVPLLNYKKGWAMYAGESTDDISQTTYPKDCEIFEYDNIPVVNNYTVDFLGKNKIWLSPEMSIKQIADVALCHPDVSFGLYIIGAQELMTTRHCILMSLGDCKQNCQTCPRRHTLHHLKDRKGYEFPVFTDVEGKSHIYNSVPLDVCYCMDELIDAGINSFMIDTTLMSAKQVTQAVNRVKIRNKDKIRHTTTGHLFREVL